MEQKMINYIYEIIIRCFNTFKFIIWDFFIYKIIWCFFIKWFLWDFIPIRFILSKSWKKIRPPIDPKTGVRPPATFLIWVSGIFTVYIALYGITSQRYEARIDVIENRANSVFAQLSIKEIRKETLNRIVSIQRMKCPRKPELFEPFTIIESLFLESSKYQGIVELMKETIEIWKIHLAEVDLENAYFRKANLSKANLAGANLSKADLSEADLSEANLKGADLSGANLRGANLRKADLCEAEFWEAKLEKAYLRTAILNNTNFGRAYLSGADFGDLVKGIEKSDETIETKNLIKNKRIIPEWIEKGLDNNDIYSKIQLVKCIEEKKIKELSCADLTEANLSGIILRKANLFEANLSKANLTKSDLTKSNLTGATLTKADLTEAILKKAELSGAFLTEAVLKGADLTDADLSCANLTGANLTGADLTGADLTGTIIEGMKRIHKTTNLK